MYIETSYPRKQGQKARLLSPAYTDNSDICVKFWYHMYGNGIGTLNVYAMVGYRHILVDLYCEKTCITFHRNLYCWCSVESPCHIRMVLTWRFK